MISFIILWVTNLLINSKLLINDYDQQKVINLLEKNSENIIEKLDTSQLQLSEDFYLYKDSSLKQFLIFTWAVNSDYKYIDENWENIDDVTTFNWNIYSRSLFVERSDNIMWNEQKVITIDIKKYINN